MSLPAIAVLSFLSRVVLARALQVGVLVSAGCGTTGGDSETRTVARVGSRVIAVEDFDRMAQRLLKGPYRHLDPALPEARRELLEAMIAKELLFLEVRSRGLHHAPQVETEIYPLEARLLRTGLKKRVIRVGDDFADHELERFSHEEGYDEEVRLQHVLCATEEDAQDVLAALRAGTEMDLLAQERSLHYHSSRRGGDLWYMPVAHVFPEVRAQVLSLRVGEIYPQPVLSHLGFHVFKMIDRRQAPFEEVRDILVEVYGRHLRTERFAAYGDSLTNSVGLECDWVVARVGGSGEETVCRWEGGRLNLSEYRLRIAGEEKEVESDEARRKSLRRVASEEILLQKARELAVAADPAIRERLRRRGEELVVAVLRAEAVGQVEVSAEVMRAFYEQHPELYGPRPAARVLEILVPEKEMAEQLRAEIEGGASMEELERQHNTRQATRDRGGLMWLATRQNPQLGPLAPTALDGEVGALYGPLQVPGGFSVFRVEERDQLPSRPFQQVRRGIALVLRVQEENRRMDGFLAELRQTYTDSVDIFDATLEQVLQGYVSAVSPDTTGPAGEMTTDPWQRSAL